MITGFVPSYELDSDIGKKIANLKNLEEGWHYPTFLLYYIRNPGPLLLFDEIVVDEGAARKAIEYVTRPERKPEDYEGRVIDAIRPTDSEVQAFQDLIESELFRKERVVDMITYADFERIEQGFERDVYSRGESDAIAVMKSRYGDDYALPDPERFEAMNINVTNVLLEKLSAVPLDDILRSPLYEYKAIQTTPLRTVATKTAYDIIDQGRQVLHLPSRPLRDIDVFLNLHKDPRVKSFRKKVRSLSQRRATIQEISREIYEANSELLKLDIDGFNIIIGFFGLVAGLTSLLQGNFATGGITTATGSLAIGKELWKIRKMEKYGWLEMVRGLCEI